MPQKSGINLFTKTPLEQQESKEKTVGWLSTFGKAVIIATNVITICAFGFRVKLDQDKLDLKEKLATLERVILANSTFEQEFNLQQTKINTLKKNSGDFIPLQYLDTLEASVPQDLYLNALEVKKQLLTVDVVSQTGISLSIFAKELKNKEAEKVVITGARIGELGYEVTMEIEM